MVAVPVGSLAAIGLLAASTVASRLAARRLLRELRSLPVGLEVRHSPSPADAVATGEFIGWRFVWPFETTVRVTLDRPIRVERYGMGVWRGGRWVYRTSRRAICLGPWTSPNSTVFSGPDFEREFQCPGGWLRPGIEFCDRRNWAGSGRLEAFRQSWFFIGRDEQGRAYQGEAIIDLGDCLA